MKVMIIGASISGLFLAYSLAKEGVEVEVYEKLEHLGSPPRTLIVTNKLKEALGFTPREAILNEVNYMEIFSKSRAVKIKLTYPDLVVERTRLIELLARRAKEAGARIISNHQFEGFLHLGKKLLAFIRNLETNERIKIFTDYLVGADGLWSTVAAGVGENGHFPVALLQARVALPQNLTPDTCQVWFAPQRVKYFSWLIPESQSSAIVGLIADHYGQAKENLEAFLKERELYAQEFQQALVPLYRFAWLKKGGVQGRNIFLVGDSAAQVKVTTVGGVVTGIYGAKALSQALLNRGNYKKEFRKLKFELDLHLLVRKILNQFAAEDYDELLSLIKGEVRNILEKGSRDELRISFLKLLMNEPRLVLLGLKALIRAMK